MPGWVEDLLKEMFYGPFYQLEKSSGIGASD